MAVCPSIRRRPGRGLRRRWDSVLDTTATAVPQLLIVGVLAFAGAEASALPPDRTDVPPLVVVDSAR
ncbi:hypothetical protein V1Y59_11635 [Gordonia sp. PKS22-38]|uniref:Uncharacterized protein n=1 Tax=Gordonia prachuapensis TaxID=3115651 RepID=A0ABU7MTR5_9ACTN|nr:hypothetical protein [Gordonia sp. PKS22-38]